MTAPHVTGQIQTLAPSPDTPDFVRPEVEMYKRSRRRGQHLLAGSDAIHDAGQEYLPKWPDEDDDGYRIRSTFTELYGAFGRCVSAARGLVGAKPPALADNASEQIQAHWNDIDGEGTHGEVFAMRRFEEGLVDGLAMILVDYPSDYDTTPGMTLEDHQNAGLRPFWVPITCDQIVNWRFEKVAGRTMLTMVTIHEEVDDVVGAYGVTCATQYRTISLTRTVGENGVYGVEITWETQRKKVQGNKEVWVVTGEGAYRGPKRIPLAIGYFGRKIAPLVAEPPMGALAELNLGHYRVSSDRRYLMSIVHAPTLAFEGWTDPVPSSAMPPGQAQTGANADIGVGPNSVIKTPPDCTVKWLQAEPGGLDSSKEEKDDLVAQMASMSIAFLQQERKSQETATAHRINSIAQNATLATAARGLEDLLDDALELHGQYLNDATVTESVVNTTYDEDALDAPTIAALNGLATDGNMTRKTLLAILQRGNIIPDSVDIDDEDAALDAQHRETQDATAAAAARAHALLGATVNRNLDVGSNTGEAALATPRKTGKTPTRKRSTRKSKTTEPV